MLTTILILKALYFTWMGWILGRIRGNSDNGAGQSLNISKGFDQFMIGLGLCVIAYPLIGFSALMIIPMQVAMWSIKWGAYRDLGLCDSEAYDDESEPFIRKFLLLLGFPYDTSGTPYIVRFYRDYIGWSIRALMISSIGLAALYATGWVFYLIPVFIMMMMMFRKLENYNWIKWFSWIPVSILFAIPMLSGFAWIGFIGLLFPLQEWLCQKAEFKGYIDNSWEWAESVHGATIFLAVYIYSIV